ncbi:uncharacterized protein B0H64DRAFT_209652 [Chaetomium fimeti]|uniref:Uncharacterized protein n=1 Tax=Chaetomium fimeti TaxID=1854472 RepID=A0AAE0HB32_9PEZI|nr:hypothetical protein B0H64DRAFT_209652 [Chaetomium fimeti]
MQRSSMLISWVSCKPMGALTATLPPKSKREALPHAEDDCPPVSLKSRGTCATLRYRHRQEHRRSSTRRDPAHSSNHLAVGETNSTRLSSVHPSSIPRGSRLG